MQTWILLAWKAWGGGCSLSGKSATCWRYSVISVSLKSAHRTQLLFWLSMGPEQKLAKSGFVTDSSQNEPSQFPHRSQGTQGTARDCHLPQVRYVSFPIICQDLKMFHNLKIQLEPSLLPDHGVNARGSSIFRYVGQSCDSSFPHQVIGHVEDYQEVEVMVEESSPCVGQVNTVTTFTFSSRHHFPLRFQMESMLQENKSLRTSGSLGFRTSFQPQWPSKPNLLNWK